MNDCIRNVNNLVYRFVSTVGKRSNEDLMAEYICEQGRPDDIEYKQLSIFELCPISFNAGDALIANNAINQVDKQVPASV